MSLLKDPVLGPRLLSSVASSCLTLDLISFAMALGSLWGVSSVANSPRARTGWGNYLIPTLRISMGASAIVLAFIYLVNFYAPPFSCGPLYTSWAIFFVNQVSTDWLLLIRIFAFQPNGWVRWAFMGSLVLIDIVLRGAYFYMSRVALTPSGICATIPDEFTGFTLFGCQIFFYLSIASYFSYNLSGMLKNTAYSASPLFKRVGRMSNVLFLSIFIAQLGLYAPFYFSVLGSNTIVLVHILIAVQTLLINLSFELSKNLAGRQTSDEGSSTKGQEKSSATARESDIKRAECYDA